MSKIIPQYHPTFLFELQQERRTYKGGNSNQGSKGIRQMPINWFPFPMMIHKITSSADYNKWLKCLDAQLKEPTNQNSIITHKVVEPTNKKMLLLN